MLAKADKRWVEVVIGTDRDKAGGELAAQIAKLAPAGMRLGLESPELVPRAKSPVRVFWRRGIDAHPILCLDGRHVWGLAWTAGASTSVEEGGAKETSSACSPVQPSVSAGHARKDCPGVG